MVDLTPALAEERMHRDWWADADLMPRLIPAPIDRFWDWNEMGIEFEGKLLFNVKKALVTGDGAVQGADMISADGVPSILSPGKQALFLELLFTAPRNRPGLRLDGQPFFLGVGTQLLTWAASFSREQGYGGRIRLDGSPEYVSWYEKRGLQSLGGDSIVFEGVRYTPMELSAASANALLEDWA